VARHGPTTAEHRLQCFRVLRELAHRVHLLHLLDAGELAQEARAAHQIAEHPEHVAHREEAPHERTHVLAVATAVARGGHGVLLDLDGSGGFTFAPRVLGPDEIPVVTDRQTTHALPELAVLSVIAHRADPEALDVGRAAVDAARRLDDATGRLYCDVVFAYLARAARRKLENEMGLENYEYQSEFAKKFIEEGRRTGELGASRSLLRSVAAARGLALSAAQLEQIEACDDVALLQTWATRAATASAADEIF
jgi:hypothetical protein